jgi:hypothetical protein
MSPLETIIATAIASAFAGTLSLYLTSRKQRQFERYKATLQAELEQSKLQTEALLEKSIYVQKAQFDTEFKIYSDLWKGVCVVRGAILGAQRRMADEVIKRTSREGEVETLANVLQQLDGKVLEFKGLVEDNRPFFAADIAKLCVELIDSAEELKEKHMPNLRSAIANALPEGRTKDPLLDAVRTGAALGWTGREFLRPLTAKTDEICEAIRSRLTGSAIT